VRLAVANLLEVRNTLKPTLYPKAKEYWQKQQDFHWNLKEVDLHEDKKDWDHKLAEGQKSLLSKLFRFFTQGDILVCDAYLDKLIPVLGKQPEVKHMMTAFAGMETMHVYGYALLIETLGFPETEFTEFLNIAQMMDKVDYLMKFDPSKFSQTDAQNYTDGTIPAAKRELARTLAVYSGFMEGMQLFSTFAILLNFSRFGLMKGMCTIVEWSIRDELLHCEGMTWIFRQFIKENPEIWTDEFKKEIYEICRHMVKLEDRFIDLMFKEAGEIPGITADEVKKYIRFIADRRLADLGLKANYHVKENPLSFMDWMIMPSHDNFFEKRVTEYSKAGLEWSDDAFDF
jgi:ribonucleoside-diphosphate reductase beta chain